MSSKVSIKILVLGAGSIGSRHIRNLFKLGYFNIAVYDPDAKKLRTISNSLPVRVWSNISQAFRVETPEVVFICTPTPTHVGLAHQAIDAGADVFIEKPLSDRLTGLAALERKAKRSRCIVMVGCNYRFDAGWQKLSRIIRSRRFGRPLLARVVMSYHLPTARAGSAAARNRDSGVIADSGSHAVDYLRALFGEVKSSVSLPSRLHPAGLTREEGAHLVLEYSSGLITAVSMDYWSHKARHQLEVVTERGLLVLNFKEDRLIFYDGSGRRVIYRGVHDPNQMFLRELRHFFRCIAERRRPPQDLSQAQRVVEILLGASPARNLTAGV